MKISGLVKKVLFGTALVASTFFPGKLNAQDHLNVLNPFFQPNETVTYVQGYFTGNANKDDKINADDLAAMITNHSLYTDINANGIYSDAEDIQMLTEHINGSRPHLPADYNYLQTRQEREEWGDKTFEIIHALHPHVYVGNDAGTDARYTSYNFSTQGELAGFGYSEDKPDFDNIYPKYNLEHNGKINMPFYMVRVATLPDAAWRHGLNALLVGGDPKNLNDWRFYETQTGKPVELGSSSLPLNSGIIIHGIKNFSNVNEPDLPKPYQLLRFIVDNNQDFTLDYWDAELTLNRPTVAIENENINISDGYLLKQNFPNPANPTTTIKYEIPEGSNIDLSIYNIQGKKIRSLKQGWKEPGAHETKVSLEGLSSGVHFYQLGNDKFGIIDTKKMIFLK